MGQGSSTPTEEEQQQMEDSTEDLYTLLSDEHFEIRCPITRNKWLLPDVIEKNITVERVQAYTSLGTTICGGFEARDIVSNAKRVFAVLVLCYYDRSTIEELVLTEGLTDGDLPLKKAPNSGSLIGVASGKEFKAFRNLRPPDVKSFLERQWLVLSPVFDEPDSKPGDSPISTLHVDCPLPLKNKDHLTNTETSSVSKCELHSAHYSSAKEVSNKPSVVKIRT